MKSRVCEGIEFAEKGKNPGSIHKTLDALQRPFAARAHLWVQTAWSFVPRRT
jgi:hypothetical protein